MLIEAALKAILDRPFTLTTLQPEATRPSMGTGWCGVFKWCRQVAERGSPLEDDPTLPGIDLFVVQVDADVAEKSYADGGAGLVTAAAGLPALPCTEPCPPPASAVDELRKRVLAWLGLAQVGPRTVLCVPSKAIEAWLAAAVLAGGHPLLKGLECNLGVEGRLAVLPKRQRIRKVVREYQTHAPTVTKSWATVRTRCTLAARFERDVIVATSP